MSKIKLQIKHFITGSILFEWESENNNLKQTAENAVKNKAYLRGADLRGADLRGAYLQGAYLRGAYLQGAYLRGADLQGAYLQGADLQGADLQGAYLQGAYLRGAKYGELIIKKCAAFAGLYDYTVIAIITDKDERYIRMGCYFRTLEDWEKDFWNNTGEFPNDNSEKSQLRLFAFETAKNWIKLQDNYKI